MKNNQLCPQYLKEIVGTTLYVAPEVLKGHYDFRCDNWSLGVILYILLSGLPPFVGTDKQEIFREIFKGNYNFNSSCWKGISKEAKDLVQKLLNIDPEKRYTAK